MIAAIIVVAATFSPVEVGSINGVDPDDGSFFLSGKVEHGSGGRADIPCVVAVALPPALGHAAVVEHRG